MLYSLYPSGYRMKEVPENQEEFEEWVQAQVTAFEALIRRRFYRQIEIKIARKDEDWNFSNIGYVDELTAESMIRHDSSKPYAAIRGTYDKYIDENDDNKVIYKLSPIEISRYPWKESDLLKRNPIDDT